ncbi:hypothetical protein E3J85_02015 [Patescibacteria group bacterium]|nr:MAG: hypothetical protein E3J85_02015 [Patescibacteria group bacterium]
MKAKTIIITLVIVLIAVGTAIGGWLIYKRGDFSFASSGVSESPKVQFSLVPDVLYNKVDDQFYVDVRLDTKAKKVSAAETVIKYDPQVFKVVRGIGEKSSAFDKISLRKVNARAGTISLKTEMLSGKYFVTNAGDHPAQLARIYFKKKMDVAKSEINGIHNQSQITLYQSGGGDQIGGGGGGGDKQQGAYQDFVAVIFGGGR